MLYICCTPHQRRGYIFYHHSSKIPNVKQGVIEWLHNIHKTTAVQSQTEGSLRNVAVEQPENPYPVPPATYIETHTPTPIFDEEDPRSSANSIINLERVNLTRAPSACQVRAPRLKELLDLITKIQSGKYEHRDDETLIKSELKPYEYHHLLRIVQNPEERELRTYFKRLRYDYLPSRNLFVIRMLTPLHEHVTRSFDNLVICWLKGLKQRKGSKEVAEAARSMVFQGSTNIPLSGIGTRQPHNSYRHNQCEFPGLVVEIAWSEPVSSLLESAEAFIKETRGGVRTVVGINLNEVYEARKVNETGDAKIFIWRAKFDSSG
ncbi:hypothetical protein F4678DRAFT_413675 [Xylaria arbuscula]|nr:hypothetical protein F4678DRAFT_413675 [Xylaria arbuscula]